MAPGWLPAAGPVGRGPRRVAPDSAPQKIAQSGQLSPVPGAAARALARVPPAGSPAPAANRIISRLYSVRRVDTPRARWQPGLLTVSRTFREAAANALLYHAHTQVKYRSCLSIERHIAWIAPLEVIPPELELGNAERVKTGLIGE